jgi:ABC-type dipeptide/oligopeptide/nickel transport system ATPase component
MVEVVDKSFLDQTFQASSARDQKFIDDTVTEFNLNTEQERAFHIVANHATLKPSNKLRMYLGGMGGTGKSQVIKALMHFFDQHNEMHQFLVVAPAGSATALLNGSTYHSVLGINDNLDKSANAAKSLAQVRSKLDGVDYTFLDEVSMLSCQDMYKISSQMAKSLNVHDQAFGEMNMIFAGNFAQLPPAMGKASLYAGNVGTHTHNCMTVTDQESAVGKALWHQVTTVVIL